MSNKRTLVEEGVSSFKKTRVKRIRKLLLFLIPITTLLIIFVTPGFLVLGIVIYVVFEHGQSMDNSAKVRTLLNMCASSDSGYDPRLVIDALNLNLHHSSDMTKLSESELRSRVAEAQLAKRKQVELN